MLRNKAYIKYHAQDCEGCHYGDCLPQFRHPQNYDTQYENPYDIVDDQYDEDDANYESQDVTAPYMVLEDYHGGAITKEQALQSLNALALLPQFESEAKRNIEFINMLG